MCQNKFNCSHPEISKGKPEDCTLNQIIKCHGDQPFKDILKWYEENKE